MSIMLDIIRLAVMAREYDALATHYAALGMGDYAIECRDKAAALRERANSTARPSRATQEG